MRLYILESAMYTGGEIEIPFPVYLVQTDNGRNVLVDSGWDEELAASTVNKQGRQVIRMTENNRLINQLNAIGLTPESIDLIICTHFDEDHCGNNRLFHQAEVIIQQSHLELARSGKERRFEVTRPYWEQPTIRYRAVVGDVVVAPGVEILVTDGLVTGHQSVLFRLPKTGNVLLTIDAIRDGDMLNPGADPRKISMFDMDADKLLEGVDKLRSVLERENVQLVVFGHDGKRWPSLRKSHQFYE
jgi:N-acyl homoserine lactone hydrolase